MVVAYIANNPLDVAHFSMAIGSGLLAYQLVAERIDRVVTLTDALKVYVKSCIIVGVISTACSLPNLTFICLCIATIADKILQKIEEKKIPPLSDFMRDMVEDARLEEKCAYTGYDKYVQKLEIVLNDAEKNNAILVGPAGVGKSAIFETIAWKMAHSQFPEHSPFANKRLIYIDLGLVMADASLVGMLDGRVQKILELAKADPNVIFVIDEIHKIEQAGGNIHGKSLSIANQLKNALARPGFKVLGATTPEEYDAIGNDLPLARRFKRINVKEPDDEGCFKMIKHRVTQGCYSHHGLVKITETALRKIVAVSKLQPGFFPDKAAKMVGNVCSKAYTKRKGPGPIVITEHDIKTPPPPVKKQPLSEEPMISVTQLVQMFSMFADPRVFQQPR